MGTSDTFAHIATVIDEFHDRIETYDALDQAEILCALYRVNEGRGAPDPAVLVRLRAKLEPSFGNKVSARGPSTSADRFGLGGREGDFDPSCSPNAGSGPIDSTRSLRERSIE